MALKEKIPGIVAIQAGEKRNLKNQGYTYGIITFVTRGCGYILCWIVLGRWLYPHR